MQIEIQVLLQMMFITGVSLTVLFHFIPSELIESKAWSIVFIQRKIFDATRVRYL